MRHYFRVGPRYSPSRAPSLSPAVGPSSRAGCALLLGLLLWSGIHILLLLAKDSFNEASDLRPFLFTTEHQPDDVLRRDHSKVALKGPTFNAPSFTVKEGVQGVVGGAVAIGTARIWDLPHFMEVAMPRQKLGEVKINLTHLSEKPDV